MTDNKKKNIHENTIKQLRNAKQKLLEKKGRLARESAGMDAEIEKITNAIGCLK